jgi:AcrR family transcriptional regulator/transposase
MRCPETEDVVAACQNILRAAQAVLAAKKVSGARMRDIARSAGISLGTLHYYFPSKTGLYLAVLDEMQKFFELRQRQLMSHDLDAAGKIQLFFDQQRQLLEEQAQAEAVFLDFWGHALVDADVRDKILSMYGAWRRDIGVAIEQGVSGGEFDAGRAVVAPHLFVALLEGIAVQYLPDRSSLDLEEVFQSANQLMLAWLQGGQAASVRQPPKTAPHSRRKPYPTDLTVSQWKDIEPLFRPAKAGGRPRTTDLREIVNALLYLAAGGGSWRMLPHDFVGWQTVYAYCRLWNTDGTLKKIGAVLGVDFSRLRSDQWKN